MTFKDKSVVVTGGAQGIGKCIAECFEREGAIVHIIDVQDGPWFVGDLADKATLDKELAAEYGIDGLTACPMTKATFDLGRRI